MRKILLLIALLALVATLSSCGGDDDDTVSGGGDGTSTDQGDDGAASGDGEASDGSDGADGSGAPLDGGIAFSFSTPVHVSPSGEVTRLGPNATQFQPTNFARGADAVFAVMSEGDAEDPNLATDWLVRIDAATGELTRLVALEEIDYSAGTPRDSFGPVLPVEGAVGVVRRGSDAKTIETYDAATGELIVSIPADEYGTLLTDGADYFSPIYGGLARIDATTGERSDEIAEGTPFRDLAPDADLVAATITEDGSALSDENVERLEQVVDPVDIERDNVVITPDAVWWISTQFGISFQDGTQALHEAIVRYDRASGTIDTYVPTGELGAYYLPEEADFDVTTLSQAEMIVRDGVLFVNDTPLQEDFEDGRLLRFDPATGAFELLYTPDLAGADYHRLELLDTSPDGVWVAVTRYTITEENADGSRTSTFETTVVKVDPATGAELVASVID